MQRHRSGASDDGAILVIVLIIITSVALVTGALLTQGSTNFTATVGLRKVAGTAYAADTATKIAINTIRLGENANTPDASYPSGTPHGWVYDNNTDGTGCFGKVASSGAAMTQLTMPNVYPPTQSGGPVQTATVVCTPVKGTGLFGSDGIVIKKLPVTDPFSSALTTVGNSAVIAQDGMILKPLGSGGTMPIRGGIASNTNISVTNGTVRSDTAISANGACTTSGGGKFVPACSGTMTVPSAAASPLSAVPPYRDPAATVGCEFQPGFYNNGAALTAAVNACSVAHFASGQYYFDFADGVTWDIAKTVIGGELVAGHSMPGACRSPIDTPSTAGVQFVFGASSNITVEDTGRVELCGPSNGGAPPMTIFQQQTGSTPAAVAVGPVAASDVTTKPTVSNQNDAFVPNPNGGPTGPTLAAAVVTGGDSLTAQWTATKKNNTGELDLRNFAGLSTIPVGATVTSAKLNVTYTSGLTAGGTFKAGVAGVTAPAPIAVSASGADTDVTSLLAAKFQTGSFDVSTPTIQLLLASGSNSDMVSIDKVTLAVSYVPKALRAAVTGNFIRQQGGNFNGIFVVEGATYAPNGNVTLTPGSGSNALIAFRWGLLAWGVSFQSQPTQTFGYPLVSLPDVGYGLGSEVTAVDLKTYLCTGTDPCDTTGTPVLTSRVQFTDAVTGAGIVDPTPGKRKVGIMSWAEQR